MRRLCSTIDHNNSVTRCWGIGVCNNRVYDEAWRRRVKASVKHLNHQAHLYHMFAIAFSTVEIHHYICFTSFPSHCSSSLLSILLTCNVPESAVDPRTRTCSPHFYSTPIHILGSVLDLVPHKLDRSRFYTYCSSITTFTNVTSPSPTLQALECRPFAD